MFIATANNIGTIPPPLLDRMELIEMSGYLTEEKVEIARRHLVRKQMEENGIHVRINILKAALEKIIENYTRESGVRELDKKIGKICRKLALQLAEKGTLDYTNIGVKQIPELLGVEEYITGLLAVLHIVFLPNSQGFYAAAPQFRCKLRV